MCDGAWLSMALGSAESGVIRILGMHRLRYAPCLSEAAFQGKGVLTPSIRRGAVSAERGGRDDFQTRNGLVGGASRRRLRRHATVAKAQRACHGRGRATVAQRH